MSFKTSQRTSAGLYIVYVLYGSAEDIQYVYITCPMSNESLYAFPTSDIGYPIESDRRTAWHKLHIT
jgi:hypothetical protein